MDKTSDSQIATSEILFRLDAGPNIGLGHLQRSLSLATALRLSGISCGFMVNDDLTCYELIHKNGFPVSGVLSTESWTEDDVEQTLEAALVTRCRAVLVDNHEAGTSYLANLGTTGLPVIARDDLALYPFPCQMVVNGNANAMELPYRSSSGDTSFLLGLRYLVLRPEFWNQPVKVPNASVLNVLVILGGTDSLNLMPKLLQLLDEVGGEFTVTAVIGPYFQDSEALKIVVKNAKRSIKLVPSPTTVYELMTTADLAISAAGQTLYELAAAGCPTVAFGVAANQLGQLESLASSGLLLSSGSAEKDEVILLIKQAVVRLMSDVSTRSNMVMQGQKLVDGKGAMRVACKIAKILSPKYRGLSDSPEAPDAEAFLGR